MYFYLLQTVSMTWHDPGDANVYSSYKNPVQCIIYIFFISLLSTYIQ